MRFHIIAPDEMEKYIWDEECIIIDLREPSVYEKEHIRNAVNIPYHDWTRYIASREFQNIWKKKRIILYCERGPTSFAAAKELAEKGIPVSALAGGIKSCRGKIKERY